jgi:hypothetical protein
LEEIIFNFKTKFMKLKDFFSGLLLGILIMAIVVFFYSKNHNEHGSSKYEWVNDSSKAASFSEGANYLFVVKKNVANSAYDKNYLLAVPSGNAVNMVKNFDRIMSGAQLNSLSLKNNETFFVDIPATQIFTYLGNYGGLTNLKALRLYIGSYTGAIVDPGHPQNRLSVLLVAEGNDNAEHYNDSDVATQIQDLGGLCPTNCPGGTQGMPADPNSIYTKAGVHNP